MNMFRISPAERPGSGGGSLSEGIAALVSLAVALVLDAGLGWILCAGGGLFGFLLVLSTWPIGLWGFWLGSMRVLRGRIRWS